MGSSSFDGGSTKSHQARNHNYRPVAIQIYSLSLALLATLACIVLLEYATVTLPSAQTRYTVSTADVQSALHAVHDLETSVLRKFPRTSSSVQEQVRIATLASKTQLPNRQLIQVVRQYSPESLTTLVLTLSIGNHSLTTVTESVSATKPVLSGSSSFQPSTSMTAPSAYMNTDTTVFETSHRVATWQNGSFRTSSTPLRASSTQTESTKFTPFDGSNPTSILPSAKPPSAYMATEVTQCTISPQSTTCPIHSKNQSSDYPLVYHFSTGQIFTGAYLPVVGAIIYRTFWNTIYYNLNLVEPFRQLSRSGGATADDALFSFYFDQSSLTGPFQAFFKKRLTLGLVAAVNIVHALLPALASEAVFVQTDYDCPFRQPSSNNPCPGRIAADVLVIRVLQAMLALASLVLVIFTISLYNSKTGVSADPSSLAAVASMMRHPDLRAQLQGIRAQGDNISNLDFGDNAYKLGWWKDGAGATGYGIVPFIGRFAPEASPRTHEYTLVESSAPKNRWSRWRQNLEWSHFALVFCLLGTFGVVLAYYLDENNDGFNRFFNSNTFGPRFVLTLGGTIIATSWRSIEQKEAVAAPLKRLSLEPSPARSTISLERKQAPFVSTIYYLSHRYYFVAAVTAMVVFGELLSVTLSGVPYHPAETWRQFQISTYVSIGTLGAMLIVACVAILHKVTGPQIPEHRATLGQAMIYLAGSRIVDLFDEHDGQHATNHRRDWLNHLGLKYELRQMVDEDGKTIWIIDVCDEKRFEPDSMS